MQIAGLPGEHDMLKQDPHMDEDQNDRPEQEEAL